jgi:cytidylate kinase
MEINKIRDKLKAEKIIERKDKERHDFLTQYVRFNAYDPASYDLTINISRFTEKEIAEIILRTMKAKSFLK